MVDGWEEGGGVFEDATSNRNDAHTQRETSEHSDGCCEEMRWWATWAENEKNEIVD